MLQNAYFLAKIGADTAENEQHLAEILPIGRRVRSSAWLSRSDAAARTSSLGGLGGGGAWYLQKNYIRFLFFFWTQTSRRGVSKKSRKKKENPERKNEKTKFGSFLQDCEQGDHDTNKNFSTMCSLVVPKADVVAVTLHAKRYLI